MTEPIFAADSIGKAFRGRQVLKAASVWAWPGSITVLLGRNGSGKSTLLRAAVGLLTLDYGIVKFRGRGYTRPRLHRLAREGLFFLPHHGLLPRRGTVRELFRAVQWRFGAAEVETVSDRLRLGPLLDATPRELSGGEAKRIEVALALARAPGCLLADEPLAGIAPKDEELVSLALRQLADEGAALVITGHEVPGLMALADQVVWMAAGTTHGLGTREQALAHEQFRREYLGVGPIGPATRVPPA